MKECTLKSLREECGLTRALVAMTLGVTVRAFDRYEHGERRISLEQVLLLSDLYSVLAEEIIVAQLNSCRKDQ